jgi:hypothetical protein
MRVKKHLYDSIKRFVMNIEPTPENLVKYRDLLVFKDTFKKAQETVKDGSPTLDTYNATILFNSFVMPKIDIIYTICSHKKLLSLSEQEVIDWFFCFQVPLSELYITT